MRHMDLLGYEPRCAPRAPMKIIGSSRYLIKIVLSRRLIYLILVDLDISYIDSMSHDEI